ncbi:MAG TPA: type I restriction endonuclease subunit R [Bacteroidales bacterium]|nr:type I restriction endonuclease subunit R [Bacteroidales bacterium]
MHTITESEVELICLNYLRELGYECLSGPDISPDGLFTERKYNEVVLVNRLTAAIDKLNPSIPDEARADALKKVLRTESPNNLINNETFHSYLTEGIDIEFRKDGTIRGDKVYLADFNHPENNEFLAVNQFTVIEEGNNKRPDIVLFINGLPLIVIELKNPTDEAATVKTAFNQLQTYKHLIPSLFTYNSLLIVSDGWEARCGTITSDWNRFVPWKSVDGKTTVESTIPQVEVMFRGMLNKHTLLDLIRHFIVFEKSKDCTYKKVAAYHQYYAVNKAVSTTMIASSTTGDRRAGVIWHTQGSGKSLSMVFYAGKLVLSLDNPTIVVLTDRNDLDDQLFDTFTGCGQLLRQIPVQAEDRRHLRQLLNVASGGIVFTTIHKFMPVLNKGELVVEEELEQAAEPDSDLYFIKNKPLSERRNIIVIADEAHRSQYDFIDGFAKHLRDALPNASFIGFTGTPVETTDKNTQAVFGNYIDIYDVKQAVADGSTVSIFYESRLAKVNFNEAQKVTLDEQFEELTEDEELTDKQKFKSKWTRLEAIVGDDDRVAKIAEDLISHFEQRNAVMDGKAMIVCMSRRICVDMYNAITRLRPQWHDKDDNKGTIKVIMTGSATDPTDWQQHIRNKLKRKAIGERMKNPSDDLKLVIVRDMWLTGFDVPCLHTMYIDKPMRGHTLMQGIARVNRVFKDKSGGLVVDYLGIAQDLKRALAEYTASGGEGKPAFDQEEAVRTMMEYFESVVTMFDGFDYRSFFILREPEEKFKFLPVAADHILSLQDGKEKFVNKVTGLLRAFSISVPHEQAIAIRDEVAFFQSIKARIVKITEGTKKRTDEEIETAIRQIISESITSDEVIDVFGAAGLKKPNIEILDERFLSELKNMPHKNLAAELLKRLLKDEIRIRTKVNLVQSRKFSDMLEEAVKRYHNGMIDSIEFLENILIPMAREIREADRRGEILNLNFRELAFYDALETNDSAVSILGDETLRAIARELLQSVRNSTTIDWTIKESVQASLRRNIRRILRKYNYPPDKQEKAIQTVIEQAKLLAEELI